MEANWRSHIDFVGLGNKMEIHNSEWLVLTN